MARHSFIFLQIKFLMSHFPNFHCQRSGRVDGGGGGGGGDKILVFHTCRSRVVSAVVKVPSKNQ